MTMNAKNRGFMDFFGDLRLRDTFQKPTALNSLQIGLDQDNLHIEFSALNVNFNGLSPDLVGYVFRFQMIIVHYAVSAILSVLNNNNYAIILHCLSNCSLLEQMVNWR